MQRTAWVLIVCSILFSCCFAFAQDRTGSFRESPNLDVISDQYVEKEGDSFVREREVFLRQLEIITGDEETRYIIVPGDTLTISYHDRGTIQEAVYQVSSSGDVYLPLAGAVRVVGINRKQARERISAALQEYIRYPKTEVFVNISGRYIVAGEVDSPGVFRIRPNLTLMEAVVGADYDKNDARLNSIILVRGNPDRPIVTRLDILKMIRKGDQSDNIIIKPGDFVYVPKSIIANLEKFISTAYRYVAAYYGFGRIPGEPGDTGGEPDKVFFE